MSDRPDDGPDLVVEDRFALVPEWLLDAEISDAAVRLYAILLRYGNSSGARMPSRSTLARRLHKRSPDSVDRGMKDLVAIGAVVVQHRYDGGQRLTNAYHVRTSRPAGDDQAPNSTAPAQGGSRISAATPTEPARGSRSDAARVAAKTRHDRKHFTDTNPSPTSPSVRASHHEPARREEGGSECGIEDWPRFVAEIQQLRHGVGASSTRWASRSLVTALRAAIHDRGWPAHRAAAALKAVAADPATKSPMRLAEAGPWWDEPTTHEPVNDELAAMEHALLEAGGTRIQLQVRARHELEAAGLPITRAGVTRRAYELLTTDTGAA